MLLVESEDVPSVYFLALPFLNVCSLVEKCTSEETALSTLEGRLSQLNNGRCAGQHGYVYDGWMCVLVEGRC